MSWHDDYDPWGEPEYQPDTDEDDVGQTHKSQFLSTMLDVVRQGTGINFALLMEHEVDGRGHVNSYTKLLDHSIHTRWNQPCYGELRKYKETHPDDCTQPSNKKPTDLWHPFPAGKPVAVGTRYNPMYLCDDYMRAIFNAETSPWRAGIGSPEFVFDEGKIVGVLMKDTKVDPTVMVNLFNVVKSSSNSGGQRTFKKLLDFGFSQNEALLVVTLTEGTGLYDLNGDLSKCLFGPSNYYTSNQFGVQKFLDAQPDDLSGGKFEDRVDYNRTALQDIFKLPVPKGGLDFLGELSPLINIKPRYPGCNSLEMPGIKESLLIESLRTVIKNAYERQANPIAKAA